MTRGYFAAYTKSQYYQSEYLKNRFGIIENNQISERDWAGLDRKIAKYGIRNSTTTAIPPSGRTSYILDASPSIEPLFSKSVSRRHTFSNMIHNDTRIATEIPPIDHLRIIDVATQCIDEGVSKTINMPEESTKDKILETLLLTMNFKYINGIALYRDKSLIEQPESLA